MFRRRKNKNFYQMLGDYLTLTPTQKEVTVRMAALGRCGVLLSGKGNISLYKTEDFSYCNSLWRPKTRVRSRSERKNKTRKANPPPPDSLAKPYSKVGAHI